MRVHTRRKPNHRMSRKEPPANSIVSQTSQQTEDKLHHSTHTPEEQVSSTKTGINQADSYQEPKALHAQPPRPILCMSTWTQVS